MAGISLNRTMIKREKQKMNRKKASWAEGWSSFTSEIRFLLDHISFRVRTGTQITADAGFDKWYKMATEVRKKQNTLFLIGNGASASMASHFSADLAKNAHLHTQVFSDLSLITAVSNDLGYKKVFSEPLRHCANRGDMLVAISSSGRSPNIIEALKIARKLGMTTVTLSAMRPDNPISALGELNIYVQADSYGLAETCHAAILHYWMDMLEVLKR